MKNNFLGPAEEIILLILQARGPLTGTECKELIEDIGISANDGQFYIAANRMEKKGLVSKSKVKIKAIRGKSNVSLFAITQAGSEALSLAANNRQQARRKI
jgi:DNA-binding PadR family transcriptional regulator